MATETEKEIAQTIQQQLFAGDAMAVFSWGAHGWMVVPQRSPFLGGLKFFVDGRIFQGPVNVLLSGDDTYTLEIGSMTYRDVQCDQLTSLIDYAVETGDV